MSARKRGLVSSKLGLTAASGSRRQLTAWKVGPLLAIALLAGCSVLSGNGASNGGSGKPITPTAQAAIKSSQFASLKQVKLAVSRAGSITALSSNVEPSLQTLASGGDFGDSQSSTCPDVAVSMSSVDVNDCVFGDVDSTKTIVLTGDSRAQMWFDTINNIATASKYRLVFLAKSGCPVPLATYEINDLHGPLINAPWKACSNWHKFIAITIKSLAPRLVIVSSTADMDLADPARGASPREETADMLAFLHSLPPSAKVVVLGGFPEPGVTLSPTLCLSRNPDAIAKCAYEPSRYVRQINAAIRQAVREAGVGYINEEPWLCGKICPAVIANIIPYTIDGYHLDGTYAQYLTGVLWSSLKPDLN
jgi:SGNH domain (fused to AT3 domains)